MNYEIKETKIRLPIYWASYLANGDGSGLEENEETTIYKINCKHNKKYIPDEKYSKNS